MPMLKRNSWAKFKQWVYSDNWIWLVSGGVAGGVILLRLAGLLQTWELAAFDTLLGLRPSESQEDRILIVEIDESDIKQVGQWPLPGGVMAEVIEKIDAAQPRAIGLDIYRDIPVEPGQSLFEEVAQTTPNLIGIQKLPDSVSLGVQPPEVLAQKDQVGFNNVVVDLDGKVRRNLLYSHQDGIAYESLALKLAFIYLEKEGITAEAAQSNPEYLQLAQGVFPRFQPNDGGYVRADDGGYQVLANYQNLQGIEKVSLSSLMANEVPAELMSDRIVLIGSTAPSLQDFFYIPDPQGRQEVFQISGVELHANFISQILSTAVDNRPLIRVFPSVVEWGWILVWSSVGAGLFFYWRSPLKASIALVVASIALTQSVYFAFILGWWIPWIPPLLSLGGSFVVVISSLAHQEEELKRSKEFLQSIIDKIPDPIFVKDKEHRWILLNEAFCQFIGYPLEKLLGKSDKEFFPSLEASQFREQEQLVFDTQISQENEENFTDSEGQTYQIATKRSLHKDAAGNIFLVGVIHDITERKRVEEELRRTATELSYSNAQLNYLAYHDDLTGLANRKLFLETLEQSLTWASHHEQLVGLLFLDLNEFKQVNDTHGHDIGDLLLRAVAKRLINCLRASDVVSRLGGDEFTIVLPGVKKASDLAVVAQKVYETISEPFQLEGHLICVSASIGSSVYPLDGTSKEVLIKKADTEMFQRKAENRQRKQVKLEGVLPKAEEI